MKLIQKLQYKIRGRDKREIFLWGFYLSFLLVMILAMLMDGYVGNRVDAWVEFCMVFLTLGSLWYYLRTNNAHIAMYTIVALSTLTTYTYILSNEYTISIYHSIVPLGYFLLFSLRISLILTAIHSLIVVSLYWVNYLLHPEYLVYHHPVIGIASFLASLLIVLFGIVYHIAIENSYQMLARADHQKELLLKEVHHRVKNNLNIISSMLGLQMIREEDNHVREIFEKNKYRIKSIALVHEILYRHSDFERINVREYLEQLSSTLLTLHEKEVAVLIKSTDHFLPFDLVLRIGIISNELIVNSLKYAFKHTAPEIIMEFSAQKESYQFQYQDSCTRPIDTQNLKTGKSLGLRLIDMMVRQMDATLEIDERSGLNFTIRIPRHDS